MDKAFLYVATMLLGLDWSFKVLLKETDISVKTRPIKMGSKGGNYSGAWNHSRAYLTLSIAVMALGGPGENGLKVD